MWRHVIAHIRREGSRQVLSRKTRLNMYTYRRPGVDWRSRGVYESNEVTAHECITNREFPQRPPNWGFRRYPKWGKKVRLRHEEETGRGRSFLRCFMLADTLNDNHVMANLSKWIGNTVENIIVPIIYWSLPNENGFMSKSSSCRTRMRVNIPNLQSNTAFIG